MISDGNATGEFAPPPAYETYPVAPAAPPSASPIAAVGRLLRGRYIWAIALSAVFAAAGVYTVGKTYVPQYKALGIIDVAPRVPRVLYYTDEKGMPPLFEAFMSSEAQLLWSRRVGDLAM